MTCSKLAVLNKAIQGTFFKSQKNKNRLKRQILNYLRKAVANRAIHGTFLSLKKVKKRVYENYGSIFACDLEKCPGSLYLPLLIILIISTQDFNKISLGLKYPQQRNFGSQSDLE